MKSLTILPLADTPNHIVREIESYDVKAFAGFMMQARYQRYTAMRLRNDAEVAAFVLRSVARQGDDRRNVFHLAAEERSSGEAIGDGPSMRSSPSGGAHVKIPSPVAFNCTSSCQSTNTSRPAFTVG